MKMSKFLELSKVQLGENKYLVISKSSNGEISIAQQLIFKEGKKNISVFIKKFGLRLPHIEDSPRTTASFAHTSKQEIPDKDKKDYPK